MDTIRKSVKNAKTLLFVSDNKDDCKNYQQMLNTAKSNLALNNFNFKVLEATSCDEVINILQDNVVDCMLLNYELADSDAISFTLKLQAQNDYSVPPILIVAPQKDVKKLANAVRIGVSDFLVKDETSPYALFNSVKNCINMVHLKKEIGQKQAELNDLTYHDRLSGLPNRFFFESILNNEIARAKRGEQTASLLMIDIDDFKHVNDTLGHHAGDEVIIQLAKRIENAIRRSDIIARIDGDGFAVILPELTHPLNASRVAEKISNAVMAPFKIKNGTEEVFLTCSIGISNFPSVAQNASDLLRSAGSALHESKENGKNTISYFRKDINDQYINYIKTVKNLKMALSKKELYLHYQPKYDVNSQKITGAEALLRWQHGRTNIPPDQFIHIAERSRLMPQIGSWVFEEGIKQAAQWRKGHKDMENFTLSINLSPYQLGHDSKEFLAILAGLLQKYEVPAGMIEIEITETALMQKITNIQKFIKKLAKLGVKVAIDDFGTGFSSLERLKNLDVTTLKIDKSFIQGIERHEKDAVIARAAINLGQNLGLRVVAEGVETALQLAFLKENHCNELQGFMLARPMKASELSKMLA
jgi:diguanylate cyclase (GGDEF)-like protein